MKARESQGTLHYILMFNAALLCLAMAIYHEGRSEPLEGQLAIGNVIINRALHPNYPNSICAVVKEGGTARDRCQFSFYCDGKSDKMTDSVARDKAISSAVLLLSGIIPDNTLGALFYHADYVEPSWAVDMELTANIGTHLFYKMP